LARYRQGRYIVEEGYAMIDQDGERAHQETFAETPGEASRLLWSALGYDAQEGDMDTWTPGLAVLVTDTGIDYPSKITSDTVVPLGVWEWFGDPYVY
jgi:hypothetical protein